jgi:hypothetical protein
MSGEKKGKERGWGKRGFITSTKLKINLWTRG